MFVQMFNVNMFNILTCFLLNLTINRNPFYKYIKKLN